MVYEPSRQLVKVSLLNDKLGPVENVPLLNGKRHSGEIVRLDFERREPLRAGYMINHRAIYITAPMSILTLQSKI